MTKRNRLFLILGISFLALSGAYVVLVRETVAPEDCTFTFDLGKARALTSAIAGERPKEIRAERITTFMFPAAAIAAGAPWQMRELPVYAYELIFPDYTVLLDAAMSESMAEQMQGAAYDNDAWARLSRAMQTAKAIYVSHEHGDHMGGLFVDGAKNYAHAQLTPEQLAAGPRLDPAKISDEARAELKPLVYDGMKAVGPGLVLVKAPGHTPGSQWFFVTRADGTELLFVGDTAWHMMNIEKIQGPPRLASFVLHNDRDANACQLATLHKLQVTEPHVQIVVGHDGARMHELETGGFISPRFQ